MSSKRRFHLGIDYGTSASKIVFRDYGAPGGEAAFVALRDGAFRIPSRVCVTATDLVFGDNILTSEDCDIYESVKMRAATDITGNPEYYLGPANELPNGFNAKDLAVLSVWYLISEGHRAITRYLGSRSEDLTIGMTMGVPMAFFKDERLRSGFLSIARQAWSLYRTEGAIGSTILAEKALDLLRKHSGAAAIPIPQYEVRDWIRSEAESAMWSAFRSPAIPEGPYAKVDIGAGTTHASLFRIYSDSRRAKVGLAFLGAVSVPVGMDAVDRAIAESQHLEGDFLVLRGSEEKILRSDPKAEAAMLPVREEIYEAYRKSWIETYHKIRNSVAELERWRGHKVFVIGGGSFVPALVETVRIHPGRREPLELGALEQPTDLLRADSAKVSKAEMAFVGVAYGLSVIGLSIPEVYEPDQIPPLPDMSDRRVRLESDDIYAK